MICKACQTVNEEGVKYCVKCGTPISEVAFNNIQAATNQSINNYQQQTTVIPDVSVPIQNFSQGQNEQVNSVANNTNYQGIKHTSLNIFMYIIAILLKPFQSFKEEEAKLTNFKNSLVLTSIISGIMMLVNLLTTMISVVVIKKMEYSTFKYKTTFEFANLKELNYLNLIGKNFLIYIAIIAAIAFVYYIGTLMLKKNTNFVKMLSITATAMIPYVIIGMILSPLLGKIWLLLATIALFVGIFYSLLIFISLINDEIKFEKVDYNIYFNLICLSVLSIAGSYLYTKIITSGIKNVSSYLNF